ncbi:MAG: leucine-rich repeat domain-containing protein [Bacilli bacterium]|nr:leucine-rich repeat domain-containing protein [Bacilli bacterium]
MLKHSFSDFSYAVNTTSSKKGYKEILVCYIYNGIEVLRKVYIRENPGTSYVFEAKKIIDQEMRSGALASYSHKFIRRNKKRVVKAKKPTDATALVGKNTETAPVVKIETAPSSGAPAPKEKKNIKGHLPLIITASVAVLAIVGMAVGMVFLGQKGGKEPEPEAGYDVVFHIPSAITLESGERTSKGGEKYECKFSINNQYYYQYGVDGSGVEIYMGNRKLEDTQVLDEYDFDVATGYLNIKVPTENAIHITVNAIPKTDVPVSDYICEPLVEGDWSKVVITGLRLDEGLSKEEVVSVEFKNHFEDEKGAHDVVGIGLPAKDGENDLEYGKGILNGFSNLQNLTIPFIGLDKEADPSEDGRHLLGALFGEETFKGAETLTYQDYYDESGKHYDVKAAIPSSLRKVTVTNATSIPEGAFSNCAYIQEIDIQKVGDGITQNQIIKKYACHGCRGLSKFTCPTNVVEIKEHAFDGCQTLASFDFTKVGTIGERAFKDCLNMSNVYLPEGVTTIKERAFENFEGLIKCYVDEDKKPESWDEHWAGEYSAVAYGVKNPEINPEIDKDKQYSYIVVGEEGKKSVYIIQYIGDKAKETIEVPAILGDFPVSQIGTKAFMGVEATTINMSQCSGLVSVGSYSFANCPNLTNVSFYTGEGCKLESIGTSAFANCEKLAINDSTSPTFPSTLTTVGSSAFINDKALVNLKLSYATLIGNSAFENCTGLTKIALKDTGNGVTLGDGTFKNCSALKTVTYRANGIIPSYCFYNTALQSIEVSTSVKTIGDYAYALCSKATEIKISSTVLKEIGSNAFLRCKSVNKKVDISSTVLSKIGASAFQDCYNLPGIYCATTLLTEIPDSVCYGDSNLNYFLYGSGTNIESIGAYAFAQDQNFAYLGEKDSSGYTSNNKMSSKLGKIGDRAFINCVALGRRRTGEYAIHTNPLHIQYDNIKKPSKFEMGEQVFYGWYDYINYSSPESDHDYNCLKIDSGWIDKLKQGKVTGWNWTLSPITYQKVTYYYYSQDSEGWPGDLFINLVLGS